MENWRLKDWNLRMERIAQEEGLEVQEGVRSRVRTLKNTCLDLLPVVWGAAWGGLGRATGQEYLPAVPPVIDLMMGHTKIRSLIYYGFGVTLAYSDKIFGGIA